MSTLALVESPTQLLNVIEWAGVSADAQDGGLEVAVLAPRDQYTVRQLRAVAALATGAGLAVDVLDVRSSAGHAVVDGSRLVRRIARADRLVVGDPFSGLIQTLLPFGRPSRVVIVDDGTATWEYADCVNSGRPLVRWRAAETGAGRTGRGGRATRLLSPATDRELTVFSCLHDATPVGGLAVSNEYAWTRARSTPEVRGGTDLLGASLVENGVVERRDYLQAVAQLARSYGPIRYIAHRRESQVGLAAVAALPGVAVVRGGRPVELALREGPVARRLITFPSTAAHTLPRVLAGTGVCVQVRRIEPEWFTAQTTPHARRFVQRIADQAPASTELEPA